jgi:hypothetical protein
LLSRIPCFDLAFELLCKAHLVCVSNFRVNPSDYLRQSSQRGKNPWSKIKWQKNLRQKNGQES